MRVAEFAFPGPLRDALVQAIIAGDKTATASLRIDYTESDPEPVVGERELVVDSTGSGVAVIETTDVRLVRLVDVDDEHARAEGEGFADAHQWRTAHERFWRSADYGAVVGDPEFDVDDDTVVVLQQFRVVEAEGTA